MKQIKKHLSLLMALGLSLSLTACGGSNSAARDYDAPAAAESGSYAYTNDDATSYDSEDYGYYAEYEEADVEAPAEAPSGQSTSTVVEPVDTSKVKMIYTANLTVEVLDLNEAVNGMNRLLNEMGGYCQSSDRSGSYGNYRRAYFTVRIPSEHYRAFVDAWSDSENCKLISAREDSEDVGSHYFDIETRLNTLRNKMDRLQALLAEATEMEDIIYIESAISDTEYEIEMYTSDLNRYDSLINYSTVNLTFEEVVKLAEVEEPTFLQRLGQNFKWGIEDFVEALEELAIWIVYNIIGIVLFVAIFVGVVLLLKKAGKRRKNKPAAKAPVTQPAPAQQEPKEK